MSIPFPLGEIRETAHRGSDDLLSAGLGLAGLRAAPATFTDANAPTPAELRRRSIRTAWTGIADLGPLGGYGSVYGAAPPVPGREFHAFARLPGATQPHRVLAQVPDAFNAKARCLIVTASSGSRGIYGMIAVAGAWGLPRGCAVAYTDKGAGSGYFDTATDSGVALDGTRAERGSAELEFAPDGYSGDVGIAIKHAHSTDNPEAHWGEHLLQAAQFGLAMLDRAFPEQAPFTPQNTRVIAVGLSNGGTAVLQAAGIDDAGWLDGVVAVEPNVYAPKDDGSHSRSLYDYASEAALLAPCALLDARFDDVRAELAKLPGNNISTWPLRCATLRDAGLLGAADVKSQAAEALARLHADGWEDAALATAASTTAYDMWRAFGATYASAYTRSTVGAARGGFRFSALGPDLKPRPATTAERAAWWSDTSGIPPGNGVFLVEDQPGFGPDPAWQGIARLRELWIGTGDAAQRLRESVQATQVRLPRDALPIFVVHGADDGLIPAAFSSDAYVAWLRANDREAAYWRVPHAQHFDSFLSWLGFGNRYVPMLAYAYAALDRMYARVVEGAPLDPGSTPAATPRGAGMLEAETFGIADRVISPRPAIKHPSTGGIMSNTAVDTTGLARTALRLSNWAERWFPDAYIFAALGVVIVALAALAFGAGPTATAAAFGDGFWSLIPFTMQMTFVVIGGYVVATAPPVARLIDALARVPRTGRSAVAYVAIVSMLASLLNWGFSLVFGSLLVRAIARREDLSMDYRAAGAAAYLGLGATWAMGLSSSAAQLQATPASIPKTLMPITGVIPFGETIFLWQSVALTAVLIVVSALIAWWSAPGASQAQTAREFTDLEKDKNAESDNPAERKPGEWFERTPLLTILLALLALGWLWREFATKGAVTAISNLNTYNFLFIMAGLLLHWRPRSFLDAVKRAVPSTTGVLIQFPLYGGIATILTAAKGADGHTVAEKLSHVFVQLASHDTYAVVIGAYSAILGFFVPSGGGKWVIEAPYVMQAANDLQYNLGWAVQIYNAAEALPNLINPFWMLPLLGVLGLKARDIVGFTFLQLIIHTPLVLFLLWALGQTLGYHPPAVPVTP